jgi:hypothetical protein
MRKGDIEEDEEDRAWKSWRTGKGDELRMMVDTVKEI